MADLRQFLGNYVDNLGTFWRLPGGEWSERIAGGATSNTGRIQEGSYGAPLNLGQTNTSGGLNVRTGGETTGVTGPGGQAESTPISVPTPLPSSGSGTGSTLPDRSRQIATAQAGLSAVESQRNNALSQIQSQLQKVLGLYGEDASRAEDNYTQQSATNRDNLNRNTQTALLNAARGRQGLFGTLASLGALSGTGIDLANQAVQMGANQDLTGAEDAFKDNKATLSQNIQSFRDEDARRRQEAEDAAESRRQEARNQAFRDQQKFYQSLSDSYADMENTAKADQYAKMAQALFGNIANTNVTADPINYSRVAYTPSTLANYIAGRGNTTQVQTTPQRPGQSLPGLVALTDPRRRDEV